MTLNPLKRRKQRIARELARAQHLAVRPIAVARLEAMVGAR